MLANFDEAVSFNLPLSIIFIIVNQRGSAAAKSGGPSAAKGLLTENSKEEIFTASLAAVREGEGRVGTPKIHSHMM